MKKVLYTITKENKEKTKISGFGFISDTDLFTAQFSKAGKPYIRVYEGCLKYCHQVVGSDDAFKGAFWEVVEIEGRTVEINYYIYYKLVG